MVGEATIGLAALLESRFGIRLSKKFQRADWAERPLSDGMLEYAAEDTRHLTRLADWLGAELSEAGRMGWALEECRALEDAAGAPPETGEPEDPVVRIRGARHLSARQLTALREALGWRDELARSRDRALFRVISEDPLIEAVAANPSTVGELAAIKGFPARLAEEEGAALIERLARVARLPDEELRPYPRSPRRGTGRSTPQMEALAEKLKNARNKKADEVGIARGTLLANAVVIEVARAAPRTLEELAAVEGMRRWKVGILGEDFLKLIRAAG
jgi:ribonuclease D